MAGEEAALGLLGSLLALPYSIPQQRAEAQQQQQVQQVFQQPGAITPSGGFSPEAMQALIKASMPAPYKPLGSGIPVVEQIAKGVGTAGRVIQSLAGSAPAPRPNDFLNTIKGISGIQRGASMDQFRKEQAQTLDEYRKESLDLRRSEGEENRALRREIADENIGLRRDMLETRDKTPKFPSKEQLIGIATGAVTYPGISKEQAQDILDKEKQFGADVAGAKAAAGIAPAEEKARRIQALKDSVLTSTTKTMVESAPKVSHFVDRIEKDLDAISAGPAASRYQEFMAGKVGAPNPDFTRYRTNVGLLQTLLMRMHVGARGGQQILDHFHELINSGVQSPENMRAALEEIRGYAQEVAATQRSSAGVPPATEGTSPPPPEGTATGGSVREQHPEWFK